MKLKELKENTKIVHPYKGTGIIKKITVRTITIKYEGYGTSKITFRRNNAEFNISDL